MNNFKFGVRVNGLGFSVSHGSATALNLDIYKYGLSIAVNYSYHTVLDLPRPCYRVRFALWFCGVRNQCPVEKPWSVLLMVAKTALAIDKEYYCYHRIFITHISEYISFLCNTFSIL